MDDEYKENIHAQDGDVLFINVIRIMHKNDELTKTPRPSCSMAVAKDIK